MDILQAIESRHSVRDYTHQIIHPYGNGGTPAGPN